MTMEMDKLFRVAVGLALVEERHALGVALAPPATRPGRNRGGEDTAGAGHRGGLRRSRRAAHDETRAAQANCDGGSCSSRGGHDGAVCESRIRRDPGASCRDRRRAGGADLRLPAEAGRARCAGLRGVVARGRTLLVDPRFRPAGRGARRPGPCRGPAASRHWPATRSRSSASSTSCRRRSARGSRRPRRARRRNRLRRRPSTRRTFSSVRGHGSATHRA